MVMKTKYPVTYEGHPTPPVVGDMLVWDGSEWVKYTRTYDTLTISDGEAVWDCNTGLYKKISSDISFTLKIQNIVNGMSGDLVFEQTSTQKPQPTIILEGGLYGMDPIETVLGNGTLSELPIGIYHICWVYDGTRLTYNIARYDDTV